MKELLLPIIFAILLFLSALYVFPVEKFDAIVAGIKYGESVYIMTEYGIVTTYREECFFVEIGDMIIIGKTLWGEYIVVSC